MTVRDGGHQLARRGGIVALVTVFATICIVNLALWPSVVPNYYPLFPHYGSSSESFTRTQTDGGDRSWHLYVTIERLFAGWNLLSYAWAPAMASDMYDFFYGGFRMPRIRNYDPDLTPLEIEELLTHPHASVHLSRLDGNLAVIFPAKQSKDHAAVILRYGKDHFIVPRSLAPQRFQGLE